MKLNLEKIEPAVVKPDLITEKKKDELIFNSSDHTYYKNGHVLPSVTQILQALGISPDYSKADQEYLNYCAAKGTAAHEAIELLCKNELDESTLHPDVKPYVESFKKWFMTKEADGIKFEGSEIRLDNGVYAGTVDAIWIKGGLKHVVEYKTSSVIVPSYHVQVGGYMKLTGINQGIIIHLKKDGSPADAIQVQSHRAQLFHDLVGIFLDPNIDWDQKRKEASMLFKNQAEITDKVTAERLIELTAEADKLKNEMAALKEALQKNLLTDTGQVNGLYKNEKGLGFQYNLTKESVRTSYDIPAFLAHIVTVDTLSGANIPDILNRYKNETLVESFYKLTMIKPPKEKPVEVKEVKPEVNQKVKEPAKKKTAEKKAEPEQQTILGAPKAKVSYQAMIPLSAADEHINMLIEYANAIWPNCCQLTEGKRKQVDISEPFMKWLEDRKYLPFINLDAVSFFNMVIELQKLKSKEVIKDAELQF